MFEFLKFEIRVFQMTLDEKTIKTKSVDLQKLYNFVVDNILIWIHLRSQILISKSNKDHADESESSNHAVILFPQPRACDKPWASTGYCRMMNSFSTLVKKPPVTPRQLLEGAAGPHPTRVESVECPQQHHTWHRPTSMTKLVGFLAKLSGKFDE
jgi:hypothetical protein